MLSFEALHVLDAIERKGSFAAAAESLSRAPSSLSYQVQKLEDELGLVIFDRSGHRATFTDAGHLLVERGRMLLKAADEMVADAASLAHGWELEICLAYDGLFKSDFFFPLIERLAKKSSTRLKLSEQILAGCWEALAQERADVLIAPIPDTVPQGIKVQPLGEMSAYWVAAPDHPIHKEARPVEPDVRAKYRGVAVADTARGMQPKTYNVLENQPRLTVSSMHDKYTAILNGQGIGTLPWFWVQDDLNAGRLKRLKGGEPFQLKFGVAWKRNRMGNAKSWLVRQLPNLLAPYMQAGDIPINKSSS
ncbi:LysR family transcriptional regulator [Salinivibrio costicola]|uniref:LysR family transcriptional regulator n=1 Tax=Salinivibrio costicola subsp. alcaliphilus TaxID=272773 RepID=A0ABX3KSK7_SALCS|nr:LysR family transcriptional regulator [Salinivibrio costicola]OOF34723.1 LysR family transcriptional regulator [Salinivibrio costicola subsp. alcaliphilus]